MQIWGYHISVQTSSIEHEVTSGIITRWDNTSALDHISTFLVQAGLSRRPCRLTDCFQEDPEGKMFCVENNFNYWFGAFTMAAPECITWFQFVNISASLGVLYMKSPYSWHFTYFVARSTATVSRRLNAWQSEIFIYLGSVEHILSSRIV